MTSRFIAYIPTFLLLIILTTVKVSAQPGAWTPDNGSFTRPRTLLNPNDLSTARLRLKDPFFQEIYSAVLVDALRTAIPTDSTSSGARRTRARLAKNVAFVLFIDRNAEQHPLETQNRITLELKLQILLSSINTDVGTAIEYTDWQWRSKELIDYLIAYDLGLAGTTTPGTLDEGRRRLQEFVGNLHRESTRAVIGITFFSTVKNNHALMTAAALGMGAVVLNDATSSDENERPANWINTALWNIDNLLWRDQDRLSEPGVIAGYAEGPYYLRYAFLNVLPFIRALNNVLPDGEIEATFANATHSLRHPFYDPNYDLLYEWIARIRTPDGLMPPIGDSFRDQGFPELALTGKTQFVFPIRTTHTTLMSQLNSTVDMRAAFFASGLKPLEEENRSLFQSLPEAGNLVFRSSWDSNAFYVAALGEHGIAREGGGGHNQGDASSFTAFIGDEMMALDPGYGQYNIRDSVGKASNHNLILVNDVGPAIGVPGAANGADAWIIDTFALPGLQFGRVRTAYQGAEITRNFLFLRNQYAVIADRATSTEEHEWSWLFHGNGLWPNGNPSTGTVDFNEGKQEITWERNGKALSLHYNVNPTANGAFLNDALHEETYNQLSKHTVLSNKESGTSALFLAGMVSGRISSDLDFESHGDDYQATLVSRLNGTHDVIAYNKDTSRFIISGFDAGLPENSLADARLVAFSIDPSMTAPPDLLFMKDGTELTYGGQQLLASSTRTDLAVVRTGPGEYACYARDSGTVFIIMSENFAEVVGDNVRLWTPLWSSGRIAVQLERGGYFRLTSSSSAPDRRNQEIIAGNVLEARNGTNGSTLFRITGDVPAGSEIIVYDLNGQALHTMSVHDKNVRLDRNTLPNGIYLALLRYNNGLIPASIKFVLGQQESSP